MADCFTLKDLSPANSISKYIMLTCIMRGEETPSTQGKYCLAAFNTLEFAQKVASTADSCKCIDSVASTALRSPKTGSITSEIYCDSGQCDTVQQRALKSLAGAYPGPHTTIDRKKCWARGGRIRTQKRNKKMRFNRKTRKN